MFKYEMRKLQFQLVPQSAWYKNLRSLLLNWDDISKYVRRPGKCSICGENTPYLDAHEVWSYDDANGSQKLKEIIPVCKQCHNAIHIGHANVTGKGDEALMHYMLINEISTKEAKADLDDAFFVWERRSAHDWHIDTEQISEAVKRQTGIDAIVNLQ